MSQPHRIHLKGPWNYRLIQSESEETNPETDIPLPEGRIKLPAAWEDCFGDFRGTVQYRRHFNCPTNLDARERVFIIFTGIGGHAAIQLNGSTLGAADSGVGPFEFEIKALLQPRNLLEVEVTFTEQDVAPGGLWSPVALEIRSH